MAWLAFDGAIKSVRSIRVARPVDNGAPCDKTFMRTSATTALIPYECFVRRTAASELDASLLLMPAVGFPAAWRRPRYGDRGCDRAWAHE
jgi:hypothetical protein